MVDLKREQELNTALELMYFAFRAIVAKPDEMLAERRMSRVHHRILYFVGRNPGVSVTHLLEILGVSKQALNAPLRLLIAQELIKATLDPGDRRIKQLALTDKGTQFENALSGNQRRRFESVFTLIGKDKETAWRETMQLLADSRFD
ncbi:MarR family winged helix-turn-helix transcriptional regulator [Pseudanabaena sp. PCC 6802]|uniref:MarR family winged helix-turn-helix transcriptional regulator n=1 Tax=Pseudanabaena sp. PCC 6802 TaxID=118173 RepID=UPI00034D1A88|nr:helix-turn-helix domain-containing protein [Pseudanabaena sp. PCC 6802]